MHADDLAFRLAICAAPADDTARLVYADWLEEHGDGPRAHWIRRRVATPGVVTRLGPSDSVTAFGGEVARGVRDWRGKGVYPDGKVIYRRGFAESVECTAEMWLAHADALAWHPSQTAECGTCRGMGVYYRAAPEYEEGCRRCGGDGRRGGRKGTGQVPRPFPPDAQPITEVTLTTRPDRVGLFREMVRAEVEADGVDRVVDWWHESDRWPGVAFHLPPAVGVDPAAGPDFSAIITGGVYEFAAAEAIEAGDYVVYDPGTETVSKGSSPYSDGIAVQPSNNVNRSVRVQVLRDFSA